MNSAREESVHAPWFLPAVVAISLVAFFLRIVGLPSLSMWGDSAYSVYTANLDLTRILTERIYDAHPPLYYSLLHFWSLVAGNSELATRYFSSFWGALTAPLGAVVGRKLGGNALGAVAALLIAVSPGLVYYSRLIRMYSLATFLALLSLYLFWQAMNRGGWRRWLAYFLVTLLALYTHYYVAFLVVAEGAYFLVQLLWRRDHRAILWWLGTQLAFAALYLPWLAYAVRSQAEKTAFVISHLPAANGPAGLLEQVWISFNLGVLLDTTFARPLSLTFIPLALLGALALRRNRTKPFLYLLFGALLVPIAIAYLVFLVFPFAVRPRFLLIYAPIYLTLLGMLLLGWRHLHRFLLPVALVFVLASQIFALAQAYYVERNTLEPPSIMLVEHLDRFAEPGDAVVFHANWQIGYFKSHFRGEGVATYTLDEIQTAPDPVSLESHKRVWLVTFNAGRNDPHYPLERWLDINWARLEQWQLKENRVVLYARPPAGDWKPTRTEFRDAADQPALQLTGVRLDPSKVTGGDALSVGLRWQAAQDLSQRYTVFLHLVDGRGKLVGGHDSEPSAALRPTNEWNSGIRVEDYIGLQTPMDLPQGEYRLVMGLYPTGSPQGLPRLTYVGPDGPTDTLELGTIQVEQKPLGQMRPGRSAKAIFDDTLELFGYEIDLDSFQPGREQLVHPLPEETIELTFRRDAYRRGETLRLELYWRSLANMAENYDWRLELIDERGQIQSQAEGPLLRRKEPTSGWGPGQVAITEQALQLSDGVAPGSYSLRLSLVRQPGQETATVGTSLARATSLTLRRVEVR